MRDRCPTGAAVSWATTFAGSPSIPGARSDPDDVPAESEQGTPGFRRIPLPGPQVACELATPSPAGNISDRDQRWDLPASRVLLERDSALLERPVGNRIEEYRLATRCPDLVAQPPDRPVEVWQ